MSAVSARIAACGFVVACGVASAASASAVQEAYLKASDTYPWAQLGWSVAVDGDTAVVGSRYSAYVYLRTAGTWTFEAQLAPSNAEPSDEFGRAVAISGDTIVVAAPFEDSSATGVDGDDADNGAEDAGAAYVFVREGGTWTQQAYLKASNTDPGDWFGFRVAISGDTLAVSAVFEDSGAVGVDGNQADNSAADAGATYVFVRSGSSWSQQAYLKASNTDPGDQLGVGLALDGDTLAVGADRESSGAPGVGGNQSDNSASWAGAVYVFARSAGDWSQQAYVKASNPEAEDAFGRGVGLSGDALVVGAPNEDSGATGIDGDQDDNSVAEAGAAYVFSRVGGAWSQEAYLKKATTPVPGDSFGYATAACNGWIASGAWNYQLATPGIVELLAWDGGAWGRSRSVEASNLEVGDAFGYSVALSDELLVVGAPTESSSATGVNGDGGNNEAFFAGAGYAFALPGPETLDVPGQYATIQSAIDAASTGDTIAIAKGSYNETLALSGKSVTIRGVDGAGSTVIDGSGLPAGIMAIAGAATSGTLIEGLTFRNGSASGVSGPTSEGGALTLGQTSVSIRDCRFEDNEAVTYGGAITMNDGAMLDIAGCAFTGNYAAIKGGAIGMDAAVGAGMTMSDCDFVSNASEWGGGAIYWGPQLGVQAPCLMAACRFEDNLQLAVAPAQVRGGGALELGGGSAADSDAVVVEDCEFRGCVATTMGGAVLLSDGVAKFERCEFTGNSAQYGGAVGYNGAGAYTRSTWIRGCMITGNSAQHGGAAGSWAAYHQLLFVGTTIAGNSATGSAGGLHLAATGPHNMLGTVLWGNSAPMHPNVFNAQNNLYVRDSDVQGSGGSSAWNAGFGLDWGGNIDADPQFTDVDKRLAATSPCIDAAIVGGYTQLPVDLDGHPRTLDGDLDGIAVTDMGAYELDPATGVVSVVHNITSAANHASFTAAIAQASPYDALVGNQAAIDAQPQILWQGKPLAIRSFASWLQPAGGLYVLADGALLGAGTGGGVALGGTLRVPASTSADLDASTHSGADPAVDVLAGGAIEIRPSASLFIEAPSVAIHGTLDIFGGGTASCSHALAVAESGVAVALDAVVSTGSFANGGEAYLLDATVVGADGIANHGFMTWRGDFIGDTVNDGTLECVGDSVIAGDLDNGGAISIQLGTLVVTGSLTNGGTIEGDLVGGVAGDDAGGNGVSVGGDFMASAASSMDFPDAAWTLDIGGGFDVAIDSPSRLDLAQATVSMSGAGSSVFEAMSRNIGASPAGLEPGGPGAYPIGTLVVRSGAVVTLVDAHDNDLGAPTEESVYASTLVVQPGGMLVTNGIVVFHGTAIVAGEVDDLAFLVPIGAGPGDIDGDGAIGGADLGLLLSSWGTANPAADLNGDGVVDGADIGLLLSGWTTG